MIAFHLQLKKNSFVLYLYYSYDYYLETDQVNKELAFVLRKFGLKTPPAENEITQNSHSETKNQRKKAAVESVEQSTYAKMVERFQDDFEVFGYPIPSFEEFKQQYGED